MMHSEGVLWSERYHSLIKKVCMWLLVLFADCCNPLSSDAVVS